MQGWLNGYAKEVRLVHQVFTNNDGSTGIWHAATSRAISALFPSSYKKRVASGGLSQEPEIQCRSGEVPDTDAAHAKQPHLDVHLHGLQARMFECLSVKTKLNPMALRAKLRTNATRSAFLKNYDSSLLLRKVTY